jgi:DNA-binding transcriptional MerR regulator
MVKVLMTAHEVGEQVGAHYMSVINWERRGLPVAARTRGGRRLYEPAAVLRFLKAHRLDRFTTRWKANSCGR